MNFASMPLLAQVEGSWLDARLLVSILVILIVIHVILITVAYLTYFERKISGWMQDRLGPNRVGPIGLLQPIADGIKFLVKEDYTPSFVDKALFTLAPMAIIIPALIGWAVIPWGGYVEVPTLTYPILGTVEGGRILIAAADVNIGIVYLLAVGSLGVYGVTLGGWASNNKYSFFGGLRASAGMVSYEIPLGLAVLCTLLLAGTVTPQGIIDYQVSDGWLAVAQPVVAILFYICILAESNRAPFDNAEAEQELVGGYHTEYSSQRFALFFLAEYAHIVTGSAFFVLLFLGGYHLPFVSLTHPESMGIVPMFVKFSVFYAKVLGVIFVTMWVRWTIPRIRWDQVMKLAWNGLIPIGITALILTSVMVYFQRTTWYEMLMMNVLFGAVVLLLQAYMPRAQSQYNRRIPMAGSRFNPLPSETAPPAPVSREARREEAPKLAATH